MRQYYYFEIALSNMFHKKGRYVKIVSGYWSFIFLLFCFKSNLAVDESNIVNKKDIKILVLIIASDQLPVYVLSQDIWRAYMHLDPLHVEAYFIKADHNLSSLYEIRGDIIWSRATEGFIPQSAGILNKTLLSMQAMMPRLHEFDYVLRTNLSSFYVFPRLLEYLKTLPDKGCYSALRIGGTEIGSGAGFILSTDLVRLLVDHKDELWDHAEVEDDLVIGRFLNSFGIKLIPHDRMDFPSLPAWRRKSKRISPKVFQFRVKSDNEKFRKSHEIYIQKCLLEMFYNIPVGNIL